MLENNKDLYSVANKFIDLARDDESKLSSLKLMNLVYLAYCHYLDKRDKSLFLNDIKSTRYGPRIPVLIEYFGVSEPDISKYPTEMEALLGEPIVIKKEIDRFLSYIYSVYGGLSDYAIEEFTKKDGSPSSIVYNDEPNRKITDQDIKDYYRNVRWDYEKMSEFSETLECDGNKYIYDKYGRTFNGLLPLSTQPAEMQAKYKYDENGNDGQGTRMGEFSVQKNNHQMNLRTNSFK